VAFRGADVVARVCEILRDEVHTSMGLCGSTKIEQLTPDLIVRVD
jgi:isopentenyl diphosphate isomerase/L-lactate dehydrogenase-like FMN-dependent dehydrogenase